MQFKYIIMNDGMLDIPVIFSELISHRDAYRGLKDAVNSPAASRETPKVVGAGRITLYPKVECYGDSHTLGVVSRGQVDADVIFLYNNNSGFGSELYQGSGIGA